MSISISYHHNCNRWMTVAGLCGDVILVLCDAFMLYYTPVMTTLLKQHLLCTNAACFLQCLGNHLWCSNSLWDYRPDGPIPYLFMIPYGVKMYLLLPMLEVYGANLEALLFVKTPEDVIYWFPLSVTFFSSVPVRYLDDNTKNLHILKLIIQALESAFLRTHSKLFTCDESINLTAEYIKAKNQLQQYETENKQLKEELDQLKECHGKSEKDLKRAQEAAGHLEKKLQANMKCCICQDRVKNILLKPCKHLSLCEQCLDEVLVRRDKVCPLCRKKIEGHDKVFL